MPRPREFDIDEALDQAMRVFWAQGYRKTSLRDLLDAMGIGQGSFYEAFESKRDLYLRSLRRYKETIRGPLAILERGEGGVPAIREFFEVVTNAIATEPNTRGCFFGTASVENAGQDPEVAKLCVSGFRLISDLFQRALVRSQATGEIPDTLDPRALAHFFTSTFYGLQVLAKSGTDRAVLENAKETALRALEP